MHSALAITVAATAIFHYYKEMLVSAVITFQCMIYITKGHHHHVVILRVVRTRIKLQL
jgi:hypothetical protein